MNNDKCPVCGGTLIDAGNGVLRCKYCKNTVQATQPKVQAQEPAFTPVQRTSNAGVNVFDKNINGVLEVACIYGDEMSAGSGFLIDESGYAITNAHVVCNGANVCKDIKAHICGQWVDVTLVALGDENGGQGAGVDLALLKLDKMPIKATPLSFADFDTVRNGEQVYVIGNSLGDGTCITSGIVSDKSRELNGERLLMTDCAINGGNSGGPIFNANGEVIGAIVSSRVHRDGSATEGMNYAIPIDTVEEFICGKYRAVTMKTARRLQNPNRFAFCPRCATPTLIGQREKCMCTNCGNTWQHTNVSLRGTARPCPKCGKMITDCEGGIWVCWDHDPECEF